MNTSLDFTAYFYYTIVNSCSKESRIKSHSEIQRRGRYKAR